MTDYVKLYNEELVALRNEVTSLKAQLKEWNAHEDDELPFAWTFSRHLRRDSQFYVYDTKTLKAVAYYGDSYHAKAEAKKLNDLHKDNDDE